MNIKPLKLYWKVAAAPTGRYRSFERRDWPGASYDRVGNNVAVWIRCADSYSPDRAKTGQHAPLQVLIADYRQEVGFTWRAYKHTCATLAEAKELAAQLLTLQPELRKKGY